MGNKSLFLIGDSFLRRLLAYYYGILISGSGGGPFDICVGDQNIRGLIGRVSRSSALSPHVVLIIGTNDALHGRPGNFYKSSLRWLLRELKKKGVLKVFLCTLPPIPCHTTANELVAKYNREIFLSANLFNFVVIVDSSRGLDSSHFSGDLFHPNNKAVHAIAKRLDSAGFSFCRFFLEEVKGDLFSCRLEFSLAHCVVLRTGFMIRWGT